MKQDSDLSFRKGGYVARFAETAADLDAAQRLRHLCFCEMGGGTVRPDGRDADDFDSRCQHVLIEDAQTGQLACCYRVLRLESGAGIGTTYAAQYYDLDRLQAFPGPMAELGRFCIRPGLQDADVLRVAWGALTRLVDAEGIEMLFGCSSFVGTDDERYHDAFAMLRSRYLAPDRWAPRIAAPDIRHFNDDHAPDMRAAMLATPPLLRTYLSMGGWVSDHAVVDHDLNTLHVFTGLEIRAIPAARARALRAVAG